MRVRFSPAWLFLLAGCVDEGRGFSWPAAELEAESIGSVIVVVAPDEVEPFVMMSSYGDGLVLPFVGASSGAEVAVLGYRCSSLSDLELSSDGRVVAPNEGFLIRAPDAIFTTTLDAETGASPWARVSFSELEATARLGPKLDEIIPPQLRAGDPKCSRYPAEDTEIVAGESQDGRIRVLATSGPDSVLVGTFATDAHPDQFSEILVRDGEIEVVRYRYLPKRAGLSSGILDGDMVRYFSIRNFESGVQCTNLSTVSMHSIALSDLRAQPEDGALELEGIVTETATLTHLSECISGRLEAAAVSDQIWIMAEHEVLAKYAGGTWTSTVVADVAEGGCEPDGGLADCRGVHYLRATPDGLLLSHQHLNGVFALGPGAPELGLPEFRPPQGGLVGPIEYVPYFRSVVLGASGFEFLVRRPSGWIRLPGTGELLGERPRTIAPAEDGFYAAGSMRDVVRYLEASSAWSVDVGPRTCAVGAAMREVRLLAHAGGSLIVAPRQDGAVRMPVFALHAPNACTPPAAAP